MHPNKKPALIPGDHVNPFLIGWSCLAVLVSAAVSAEASAEADLSAETERWQPAIVAIEQMLQWYRSVEFNK